MVRGALALLAAGTALLLPSCVRGSDGSPTMRPAESSTAAASSAVPTDDVPGVVPTPAATSDEDCAPVGVPVDVRIDDPKAPTVVVGVPDGWTATPAQDGVTMQGRGVSGTVTITATPMGPAQAFRRYADDLTAESELSTLSLLPAQTCGFSGQKLMGQLDEVVYEARIVHVPGYLIAVYAEAPTGTPDFDAAAAVPTGGLRIGLP
ncbi:hypothetical protein [Mycolicibacterium obuense]|uniref:Lipoprotein LpqN n=1 Tax=Mycolicibacterium obuense TaxID=1807 RepID=A0A0M2K4X3_9MYCO|nr:hypothetical protein [Mycolicibacterium obuense]KKF02285.1 hypothetical protein WN67_09010 [Mycolicibacterium obuense]